MLSNTQLIEEHLDIFFKEIGELKPALPKAAYLLDKLINIRKHTDEQLLCSDGADLVLQVASAFAENNVDRVQAISLAQLIEITVNLLVVKLQTIEAESELQGKPHVLH